MISPSGAGTVKKYPVGYSYAEGTRVQLTARPYDGWRFTRWSGDIADTRNPITIVMNRNYRVYAEFTAVEPEATYTLTTAVLPSTAYGWVKKDPNKTAYSYDERVELTAVIDPHVATTHVFSHWDIDGITYDVGPRVNIFMDKNRRATAFFMKKLY